jgi:phenylpropionate dioxygenase-like ring-hydroxylating dioxygenase large terminal subunit
VAREVPLASLAMTAKGTPGGDWLRRYWLVVGIAEEVRHIPRAVRVLGEDLVLFRTRDGKPGLLGLLCPHRGASLEYADVEPDGLRCIYHGWAFDLAGQCFDQPAEPPGSRFREKVRQTAYPVREMGGLLFAYMGPHPEDPPPLPQYAPLVDPAGVRRLEPVRELDYNWFNFFENVADPAHLWILHRHGGYGKGTWGGGFFDFANPPAWDAVETPLGLQIVMTKPGPTPDTEFADVYGIVLPTVLQINDTEFVQLGANDPNLTHSHNRHAMFLTPADDGRFRLYTVDCYTGPNPDFHAELQRKREQLQASLEADPDDHRKYAGFRGSIRLEDIVTQSTQPQLGCRAERLGASDRGVIMLRKLVQQAIVDAAENRRPKGVLSPAEAGQVIDIGGFAGIRPRA